MTTARKKTIAKAGKQAGKVLNHLFIRHLILAVCSIVILGLLATLLTNMFTRHNRYIEVPDFTGMDIEQARTAGSKASLIIEVNDSLYVPGRPGGMVLEQMPAAGAEVKSGRRIFVTLNSFRQKMVTVPYVAGYSLRQAKNNLELAGLGIDEIIYREDMATNNVIEQRYKGRLVSAGSRTEAERGSGITLIVGWNPESRDPAVPKVVGFPLNEARSRLWEAGFNVGKVDYDTIIPITEEQNARVFSQSQPYGIRITPGSRISLKLSLDRDKVGKGSKAADRAAREAAEQAEAEQLSE